MTTPRTPLGKGLVVVYGFMGCAGCILMFNLFLERIVTSFAVILRAYHEYKIRRRRINEQLALEREKRAAAEGTVRDKSIRTIPKLTVNECDSRLDWGR